MSHAKHFHSQNAPFSHALTELPDLSALAKSLHDVAQALLAISNAYRVATNSAPAQRPGQTPDPATDHSHARYAPDAPDILDAMDESGDDLCVTARLMQNFDEDKQVDGFTMQMIGEHLSRPLDTLSKTCSFFVDFDLVRVTPTA